MLVFLIVLVCYTPLLVSNIYFVAKLIPLNAVLFEICYIFALLNSSLNPSSCIFGDTVIFVHKLSSL